MAEKACDRTLVLPSPEGSGHVTMAGATGIPLATLFVVSTALGGGLWAIRAKARRMKGTASPR